MGLLIPDVILLDICNGILHIIREDFRTAPSEQESMLYSLYNSISLGDEYDMYAEAKAALITDVTDPKHIDAVTLTYNQNPSSNAPIVCLNLPSESQGNGNSLGIGAGDIAEEVAIDGGTMRRVFNRRYDSTYHLIIGTDNRAEAITLYHFFKNMLVACTETMALKGLENIRIGGQDLRMNPGTPDKIFNKAITISFQYEQSVQEILSQQIRTKLFLYWKIKGTTTRQGPIVVDANED
jgi:hypothetical protein